MATPLVSDDSWAVVEPLLPPEPPKPKGGRSRIDDRTCLTGILFVLKAGLPWEMLPQEMGCAAIPVKRAGEQTGPKPTDGGWPGTKRQ